jgi:ribosomal protein S18 acetylase RimI-like enzyme
MNIRLASKDDVDQLKELDAKDRYYVEELAEYHSLLDDNDYVNHFLKEKNIFIVEEEEEIMGFLIAQIKDWMFHHEKIIWIEHIVVDPERRGEGLAQLMIKHAISRFRKKEKKITHVYSITNPDNKASLKMSEKFDPFTKTIFMISKKLD